MARGFLLYACLRILLAIRLRRGETDLFRGTSNQPKPGQPLQNVRVDHGKLVNQRAVECAGQVEKRLLSLSPHFVSEQHTADASLMPLNSKVLGKLLSPHVCDQCVLWPAVRLACAIVDN